MILYRMETGSDDDAESFWLSREFIAHVINEVDALERIASVCDDFSYVKNDEFYQHRVFRDCLSIWSTDDTEEVFAIVDDDPTPDYPHNITTDAEKASFDKYYTGD